MNEELDYTYRRYMSVLERFKSTVNNIKSRPPPPSPSLSGAG